MRHYSELERRKPRLLAATAFLAATVAGTATITAALLADLTSRGGRDDWSGQSLADGLALLATDPLLTQDRIALAVLANRFVGHDRVQSATLYTIDNRMVAVAGSGAEGARAYTAPVLFEEEMIGFVRIDLTPAPGLPLGWLMLVALTATTITTLAAAAAGLWRERRKPAGTTPRPRNGSRTTTAASSQVDFLVVNLYNRISLPPDQHQDGMALARRFADEVIDLYDGTVVDLPHTGLALAFDSGAGGNLPPGDPFQSICAGLLMMHVLALALKAEGCPAQFRFGMHTSQTATDAWAAPDDVHDAMLLSAIARDDHLAVSDRLFSRVRDPARFEAEALRHPVIADAHHLDGGAWLIASISDEYWALIAQQADRLLMVAAG